MDSTSPAVFITSRFFRSRSLTRIFAILSAAALIATTWLFFDIHTSPLPFDCHRIVSEPPPSPPQRFNEHPVLFVQQKERQRVVLGKHEYGDDGLLRVSEDGPHPIYELMLRAEKDWNKKLKRASKTLEEAVAEYRRRYKRKPPKGFNLWWQFVQENNVQLPDEYDSINTALQPYWAIGAADLQVFFDDWKTRSDVFIYGKEAPGDPVGLLSVSEDAGKQRMFEIAARRQIMLAKDVEHMLPPFKALFTPHDNPDQILSHAVREYLIEKAARREYADIKNLPWGKYESWAAPCSHDSPLRSSLNGTLEPREPVKTFIHDHDASRDVCQHPEILTLHGQYLRYKNASPGPEKRIVPHFGHSTTRMHRDITLPTIYGWVGNVSDDVHWDEKIDDRLLWRGGTTGIFHSHDNPWQASHRARLVNMTNARYGEATVLPPTKSILDRVGEGSKVRMNRLNAASMDIAFAGERNACEESVCELLEKAFEFRRVQSVADAALYKFVLDVDGHGWSGRFKRLMSTNSVIFKSTIYPEWFAERIAPWLHYVPIQVDYSDLYDVLTFFRGTLDGVDAHDGLARKIGKAGKEWSQTFWRKEDMTAYVFRFWLEYARVMSNDRESMSYDGPESAQAHRLYPYPNIIE